MLTWAEQQKHLKHFLNLKNVKLLSAVKFKQRKQAMTNKKNEVTRSRGVVILRVLLSS